MVTPAKRPTLTIEFLSNSKEPRYTFEGPWEGHNTHTVIRGVRRAYIANQRDIRKAMTAQQPNEQEA